MSKIKQKDIDNMLGYEDFCTVVNDKLSEDGLPVGTGIFIGGTQTVPVSKDDLYTLRLKMLVCKMDDEGHVDSTKVYVVDPDSLKKMGKRWSNKYRKILEKDFKPAPEKG